MHKLIERRTYTGGEQYDKLHSTPKASAPDVTAAEIRAALRERSAPDPAIMCNFRGAELVREIASWERFARKRERYLWAMLQRKARTV